MPVTRAKLNRQTEVVEDVSWDNKKITDLADPVNPQDAATRQFVLDNAGTGGGSGNIGTPEDGVFSDGLFSDFTATTPVGTAVDRFNEVLKSLSPEPCPAFSAVSCATSGVSGKLSFGPSNPIAGYTDANFLDRNAAFTASAGSRIGIITAATPISGTLASNVIPNYANGRPYPNLSFGDADTGLLHLEVNGYIIHTVDLSTFVSGASVNSNGSGFTLSAATPVKFPNGDSFNVFKYRTGTWNITVADQQVGYNTVRITHEPILETYRDSQVIDWVVDGSAVSTVYSAESITTLVMTGSRFISGVEFNTGGTFKYNITIANGYRNTYSASATAVSYNPTNATIVKDAMPAMAEESDSLVITNKTATLTPTRLLNGNASVYTTLDRTVQSDNNSPGVSVTGLFIDSTADNASATNHTFNGETRRMHTGFNINSVSYGAGTAGAQQSPWDSTKSLVGADVNHNTGLQVYSGQLIYPKTNFSTILNGPAGNVDYSAAAGLRTWLGFFYDAAAHSNFRFNVTASNVTFVPVSTGPSGNNLTLELLAPNTTKNGAGNVEWKDARTAHSGVDTDIGCYASTYGATVPTSWGCTLGAKNTSQSGNVIIVRVTASAAWSGSISQIGITWL